MRRYPAPGTYLLLRQKHYRLQNTLTKLFSNCRNRISDFLRLVQKSRYRKSGFQISFCICNSLGGFFRIHVCICNSLGSFQVDFKNSFLYLLSFTASFLSVWQAQKLEPSMTPSSSLSSQVARWQGRSFFLALPLGGWWS